MSTSEIARLASDIAAQFAHRSDPDAASSIATHIRMFWDPRMRKELIDLVAAGGSDLDPVLVAAVARLTTPDQQ